MAAAETALRLIIKRGRTDGVLRRPGADAVSAGKPWAPTDADPTSVPVQASGLHAVVLEQSSLSPYFAASLAPEATAVAYVAFAELALNVEPKNGDLFETRGDRYSIVRADLLAPAGPGILWTLHLKAR